MKAFIKGFDDTIDTENARFAQAELGHSLFVNSIPKGGTHLVRNILRMFVPVSQHYHHEFVQVPNLHIHGRAFDPARPMLSCGHLLFDDTSVRALGQTHQILLVRDPHDWVLARARFFLSDEFQQANLRHLKDGAIGVNELLNMMIMGIHQKSPSMLDIYMHNAVAWTGTAATVVRFEDVREAAGDLDSRRSADFFEKLLADCGIACPGDWRERVRIGADPAQSRTARQNLTVVDRYEIPAELPAAQKRLVSVVAPGLRALFGYE